LTVYTSLLRALLHSALSDALYLFSYEIQQSNLWLYAVTLCTLAVLRCRNHYGREPT